MVKSTIRAQHGLLQVNRCSRYHLEMKSATIYDVAERAGVSHITVSRHLNGFEGIRPGTRQRIELAIEELKYTPNLAGRHLRLQKIDRIGYIVDRLSEAGPARAAYGAIEAARASGYILDIVSTNGSDEKSIADAIDIVTRERVAGMVLSVQTEAARAVLGRRKFTVPVVHDFDLHIEDSDTTVNEWVGHVAADHLLANGHRNFFYLTGPSSWTASKTRAEAFASAVQQAGGSVVSTVEGDWSARSGYEAASRLIKDGIRGVTAIAAANDGMAFGVLSALSSAGIAVPHDMSVMGVDDQAEAAYAICPLTTVKLDFAFEGQYVIAKLIAQIEKTTSASAPSRIPRPPLVVRASTGPPPTQ
ncbi:DNA-binding transcriptional regulator, LacI/PurR family [Agreia bicolorata]|uniref:DNA-binding transcriptional regulator, LacI/PurR family n=2 Tax=Agreia bicolorata TaxID=110935 RepID=A0A1T4Y375_9MICO|nr:DNA-binding transcriptional regulator, LacI/PurR family [Agreia bicolorata]